MTTIDMECPKCGAPGTVPRDRVHSRLVCKKCFTVFHLTPSGRPILGEPPSAEPKRDDHQHARPPARAAGSDAEFEWPFSQHALLGALLVILVVVGLGYGGAGLLGRMRGAGSSVTPRAEAVAEAVARDSFDALKANCLGPEADAQRFLESARRVLGPVRTHSPTKELVPRVLVLELTDNQSKAQVVGYFTAKKGTAHEQQIADTEAEGTVSGHKVNSADLMLYFARDDSGTWKFDPARSIAQSPAP